MKTKQQCLNPLCVRLKIDEGMCLHDWRRRQALIAYHITLDGNVDSFRILGALIPKKHFESMVYGRNKLGIFKGAREVREIAYHMQLAKELAKQNKKTSLSN